MLVACKCQCALCRVSGAQGVEYLNAVCREHSAKNVHYVMCALHSVPGMQPAVCLAVQCAVLCAKAEIVPHTGWLVCSG